jgi:hypothetical protein
MNISLYLELQIILLGSSLINIVWSSCNQKEECIKKISWAQKTHNRDTNLRNQFLQLTSLKLPTQHYLNLLVQLSYHNKIQHSNLNLQLAHTWSFFLAYYSGSNQFATMNKSTHYESKI